MFLILLGSIGVVIWSYTSMSLPVQDEIVSELYNEPIQQKITQKEFTKEVGDITYYISPQYSYDIYGLVVSDNKYENGHEKNPLNMTDLCVSYGDNIKNNVYLQETYRTQGTVCIATFRQADIKSEQDNISRISHTSNNHLFPQNSELESSMKKVKIGDQVRIQGYLINYYMRGSNWHTDPVYSSTVRTDYDDSGCESIYVTNFEILKSNSLSKENLRHTAIYTGIGSIIGLLIILIIRMFRPEQRVY